MESPNGTPPDSMPLGYVSDSNFREEQAAYIYRSDLLDSTVMYELTPFALPPRTPDISGPQLPTPMSLCQDDTPALNARGFPTHGGLTVPAIPSGPSIMSTSMSMPAADTTQLVATDATSHFDLVGPWSSVSGLIPALPIPEHRHGVVNEDFPISINEEGHEATLHYDPADIADDQTKEIFSDIAALHIGDYGLGRSQEEKESNPPDTYDRWLNDTYRYETPDRNHENFEYSGNGMAQHVHTGVPSFEIYCDMDEQLSSGEQPSNMSSNGGYFENPNKENEPPIPIDPRLSDINCGNDQCLGGGEQTSGVSGNPEYFNEWMQEKKPVNPMDNWYYDICCDGKRPIDTGESTFGMNGNVEGIHDANNKQQYMVLPWFFDTNQSRLPHLSNVERKIETSNADPFINFTCNIGNEQLLPVSLTPSGTYDSGPFAVYPEPDVFSNYEMNVNVDGNVARMSNSTAPTYASVPEFQNFNMEIEPYAPSPVEVSMEAEPNIIYRSIEVDETQGQPCVQYMSVDKEGIENTCMEGIAGYYGEQNPFPAEIEPQQATQPVYLSSFNTSYDKNQYLGCEQAWDDNFNALGIYIDGNEQELHRPVKRRLFDVYVDGDQDLLTDGRTDNAVMHTGANKRLAVDSFSLPPQKRWNTNKPRVDDIKGGIIPADWRVPGIAARLSEWWVYGLEASRDLCVMHKLSLPRKTDIIELAFVKMLPRINKAGQHTGFQETEIYHVHLGEVAQISMWECDVGSLSDDHLAMNQDTGVTRWTWIEIREKRASPNPHMFTPTRTHRMTTRSQKEATSESFTSSRLDINGNLISSNKPEHPWQVIAFPTSYVTRTKEEKVSHSPRMTLRPWVSQERRSCSPARPAALRPKVGQLRVLGSSDESERKLKQSQKPKHISPALRSGVTTHNRSELFITFHSIFVNSIGVAVLYPSEYPGSSSLHIHSDKNSQSSISDTTSHTRHRTTLEPSRQHHKLPLVDGEGLDLSSWADVVRAFACGALKLHIVTKGPMPQFQPEKREMEYDMGIAWGTGGSEQQQRGLYDWQMPMMQPLQNDEERVQRECVDHPQLEQEFLDVMQWCIE